jgi:hypothetical protein
VPFIGALGRALWSGPVFGAPFFSGNPPMPIVTCPSCKNQTHIADHYAAGKTLHCPHCKHPFSVEPQRPTSPQAKLIANELINGLSRSQSALNKALAEVRARPQDVRRNEATLVAAREACTEILGIIRRLIELGSAKLFQVPKLPKRKMKRQKIKGRTQRDPGAGASVRVVGTGQSRKPGSHRN